MNKKQFLIKITTLFLCLSFFVSTITAEMDDTKISTPFLETPREYYIEPTDIPFTISPTPQTNSRADNNPLKQWDRYIGPGMRNYAQKILQTDDGGFLIGGYTYIHGTEGYQMALIKTDNQGHQQWIKTYLRTDANTSGLFDMKNTNDGGLILAGWTGKFHGNGIRYDIWIIKTNKTGSMQWNKTYHHFHNSRDWAECIQQTQDNGYVIVGPGGGGNWVLKINAEGIPEWNTTIYHDYTGYAHSIIQTSSKQYLVTGYSSHTGYDRYLYVSKINATGDLLWTKEYGKEEEYAQGRDVVETPGGHYLVIGRKYYGGDDIFNAWLILIDENGSIQKDRKVTYLNGHCEDPTSIQLLSDGGYVIIGREWKPWNYQHLWVARIDKHWTKIWAHSFAPGKGEAGTCIQQTADGGFIIAGEAHIYLQGTFSMWLLKLDAEHNINKKPQYPILSSTSSSSSQQWTQLSITSTDPDGNDIYYFIDWGDNTSEEWFGPFYSGEEINAYHIWDKQGEKIIKVKARDSHGAESGWTQIELTTPSPQLKTWFGSFTNRYPHLAIVLKQYLNKMVSRPQGDVI